MPPSLAGLLKGGRQGSLRRALPSSPGLRHLPGPAELPVSRVMGGALLGVDGVPVEVEVRISSQLPRVDVVGLPEAAVRESAARVRAAIASLGLPFPDRRVTVNLAPAEPAQVRRGARPPDRDRDPRRGRRARAGRSKALACSASSRSTAACAACAARSPWCSRSRAAGCTRIVAPRENAAEARARARASRSASRRTSPTCSPRCATASRSPPPEPAALALRADGAPTSRCVRGQEHAKRALEIAAAGGHGLLLRGAPGLRARRCSRDALPGILPPLDFDEALEVTRIHSAAGLARSGCAARLRAPVPRAASLRQPRRPARRRQSAAARARSRSRTAARSSSTSCPSSSGPRSKRCARCSRTAAWPSRAPDAGSRSRRASSSSPRRTRARAAGTARRARLPLRRGRDRALRGAALGAAARPHRPPRRGAPRAVARARREPAASASRAAVLQARVVAARARQLARWLALGRRTNAEIPLGALESMVARRPRRARCSRARSIGSRSRRAQRTGRCAWRARSRTSRARRCVGRLAMAEARGARGGGAGRVRPGVSDFVRRVTRKLSLLPEGASGVSAETHVLPEGFASPAVGIERLARPMHPRCVRERFPWPSAPPSRSHSRLPEVEGKVVETTLLELVQTRRRAHRGRPRGRGHRDRDAAQRPRAPDRELPRPTHRHRLP